jgi:hypothetical protein
MKTLLLSAVVVFAGAAGGMQQRESSSNPQFDYGFADDAVGGSGPAQAFTATGNYSDKSTKDLTATATWASSNMAIATIAPGG